MSGPLMSFGDAPQGVIQHPHAGYDADVSDDHYDDHMGHSHKWFIISQISSY